MTGHPEVWDDGLADAVAMVECQLADDIAGIAILLRHGNAYNSAVLLSKMLSEVITEQEVSAEHFRIWSAAAVGRP